MKLQPTHNKLTQNIRGQSVELLNRHLAAAIDLHGQVKQAHWNVRGPAFIAIHELFDKVAAEVEEYSDMIAERAGALGGVAKGGIKNVSETSFLKPYPLEIDNEQAHIEAVSAALAAFGDSAREAINKSDDFGDPVTADLFTQIVRQLDLKLWFVESHNAGK
jgi:starvation-inducible DNA-binding protein